MGLTSPLLPWLLGVLAAGFAVTLVLGLPRSSRRPVDLAVRSAQVVGLATAVLLTAGTVLNDQYLFYVSWGDLLGTTTGGYQTVARGNGQEGARVALGDAVHPVSGDLPPLPTPGRSEQVYTVTGAVSHVTGSVVVRLPRGYDPGSTRTYPVIESLAGYPGSALSNVRGFDLTGTYQRLVDAGVVRAPIIVMPQINTPSSLDTECVDPPAGGTGPRTETWLATDVPAFVAAHFRVDAARTSWAVQGFSYGGWCAAMLSMRHPRVFGGAMVLMGYFRPEFTNYHPYRPGSGYAAEYDLPLVARTHPPAVSLWLMASRTDNSSYPYVREFLHDVRRPMAVTAHIEASGGHRVQAIPPVLPAMLRWLARALPGFAPTA